MLQATLGAVAGRDAEASTCCPLIGVPNLPGEYRGGGVYLSHCSALSVAGVDTRGESASREDRTMRTRIYHSERVRARTPYCGRANLAMLFKSVHYVFLGLTSTCSCVVVF